MAKPIKKQVWTNLDAFGMLNGISTWDKNYLNLKYVRLPNETNIQLRRKINNFRNNPVQGVSMQDLVNGMSNELLLTPYNIKDNKTFDLSRVPYPSGGTDVQDIFVQYQPPGTSTWHDVTPQVWASGYYTDEDNSIPVNSGFIVWEDSYYKDSIISTTKNNTYSRLLQIMTDLPNESKIRVKYWVKLFDEDGNAGYYQYTDMSNPYDKDDETFTYKIARVTTSGDFTDSIVPYNMSDLPSELSGYYYNPDGTGTSKLYKLRDIINKNFRHQWKDIRQRETVWDIKSDYSHGTIPSYMDSPFVVTSGATFSLDNLDGGTEYYDDSLYIKDIHINISGNIENWYPLIQPGRFYYKGVPYRLMENPKYTYIDLSSGSGIMPSGIQRYHKTILASASGYTSDVNSFIFEDYNYKIRYRNDFEPTATGLIESSNIYRKRPYLTTSMGLDISLGDKEYYINYDVNPPVIYSSGVSSCVFVWDQVDVPSGRICDTVFSDLNPLNDSNIAYDRYFLVIGE